MNSYEQHTYSCDDDRSGDEGVYGTTHPTFWQKVRVLGYTVAVIVACDTLMPKESSDAVQTPPAAKATDPNDRMTTSELERYNVRPLVNEEDGASEGSVIQ